MSEEKLKKLINPKSYGAYWVAMHKKAFKAVTLDKKLRYEQFVHDLIEELECNHCREDALKYLREHPIRTFFNVKDEKSGSDIGCFKHSWLFHNHVNRKLGKKELDWLSALGMFSSTNGCDNCGHQEGHGGDNDHGGRKYDDKELKVKIIGRYRH